MTARGPPKTLAKPRRLMNPLLAVITLAVGLTFLPVWNIDLCSENRTGTLIIVRTTNTAGDIRTVVSAFRLLSRGPPPFPRVIIVGVTRARVATEPSLLADDGLVRLQLYWVAVCGMGSSYEPCESGSESIECCSGASPVS